MSKCKQCRPWSETAFCGVWSWSSLFANVPVIHISSLFDTLKLYTRVLQKVLSLGSDYFSATFHQTYFLLQPSKNSPFTETHFCNLFTQSRKADKWSFFFFFLYLLETLINGAAKKTSRHILISRKHFLKPWKWKEVTGTQVRWIRWMV